MTFSSSIVPGAGEPPPPFGDAPCWSALINDSAAGVCILDAAGLIHQANAVAAWWMTGDRSADVVGRALGDLLPPGVAEERLAVIRRAIVKGAATAVIGMLQEAWTRTTYRPLSASTVLSVCRPALRPRAPLQADDHAEPVLATAHAGGRLAALSDRELEILELLATGLTVAQIARQIHRTVKTVEWHRTALGRKLGATNRVKLARLAVAAGLARRERTDRVREIARA